MTSPPSEVLVRADAAPTEVMPAVARLPRWSCWRGTLPLSPVTCGVDPEGRIVVSTYPERAKTRNARRDPGVSICVLSEEWDGPYVQVDGRARVLDMPEALDGLVDYFRCISGEHPDWAEYREAMARQGKSLIRIEIEDWGPIATGGFPPHLVDS